MNIPRELANGLSEPRSREEAGLNNNEPIPFLTDPEVMDGIRGVLRAMGVRRQDVEDGVQDVYVKVLTAFRKGAAVPADVDAMRALCVTVAREAA